APYRSLQRIRGVHRRFRCANDVEAERQEQLLLLGISQDQHKGAITGYIAKRDIEIAHFGQLLRLIEPRCDTQQQSRLTFTRYHPEEVEATNRINSSGINTSWRERLPRIVSHRRSLHPHRRRRRTTLARPRD